MSRKEPLAFAWSVGLVVMSVCGTGSGAGQDNRDEVVYVPQHKDPVIQKMLEQDEQDSTAAEQTTDEIVQQRRAEQQQREDERPTLRFDLAQVIRPDSPAAFTWSGICGLMGMTDFWPRTRTGRLVMASTRVTSSFGMTTCV